MALVRITFLVDEKMLGDLKTLSSITRIKQSDYVREGIAYVLERYKAEFKKPKQHERR